VRFDADTGRTRVVGFGLDAANVAISRGGRFIAADNGPFDRQGVIRLDLQTGRTASVSTEVPGASGDDNAVLAGMSASGRFVVFTQGFTMGPPPHIRVFVRDMTLRRTRLVSVSSSGRAANASASGNAISADGAYRMFTSAAGNLVPGDTNGLADVFVRIRGSGHTVRVSLSSRGHQANGPSGGLGISADGRFRLFWSEATNLVPGDTNHQADIFVRDARSGRTFRVDLTSAGGQISRPRISTAAISGDGVWVTWPSKAGHVVPADTNNRGDVFARGPLR
jgi:hypothetical protein